MNPVQATFTPSYPTIPGSSHTAGCNCSTCASNGATGSSRSGTAAAQVADSVNLSSQSQAAPGPTDSTGKPLDRTQQAQLTEMKKTDGDVRRHEQAHLSASGGLARGGIVLNMKAGPDGKMYAVGGHVDIDTSAVKGNPAATIAKMATVEQAALAPADPSGQDRAVAAQASQVAAQARAQLAAQRAAGPEGPNLHSPGDQKSSSKPSSSAAPGAASASGQLLDVTG